jgi:CheY-like chemotaxis protein
MAVGLRVAKILVVDDEEYIVDLLSLLLEDDGHVPLRAYNGREALEMAVRERPALVIADVMMPVMDGEALVRALKADPNLAATPVILMSALGSLRRKAGADDFVTKPFDLELVRKVIQRHLNGSDAR